MSSVTAADITISTYVDNVRKFGVFFFWFLYFLLVGSWISFVFFGHPSPPTSSLYVGFIVVVVLQFQCILKFPWFSKFWSFLSWSFFCMWFLLLLIITLPCSFGSSTLLACDSKLQPIKIAQFFRMGRGYGKVKKHKAIRNSHEKYSQLKLLRWLAASSFRKGFFELPEWHQCNQVQDALSFHPHFAKFFQLKNQTSFELQVHIGKPTRWNVVILKWMDEDD